MHELAVYHHLEELHGVNVVFEGQADHSSQIGQVVPRLNAGGHETINVRLSLSEAIVALFSEVVVMLVKKNLKFIL